MVKPDKIKVKNYEKQIHSKLKECENEEERQAYKDYCISECRNWDLDVNYHKAVENVFGYKYKLEDMPENMPEDVPF